MADPLTAHLLPITAPDLVGAVQAYARTWMTPFSTSLGISLGFLVFMAYAWKVVTRVQSAVSRFGDEKHEAYLKKVQTEHAAQKKWRKEQDARIAGRDAFEARRRERREQARLEREFEEQSSRRASVGDVDWE